jgi:hypothetical protein
MLTTSSHVHTASGAVVIANQSAGLVVLLSTGSSVVEATGTNVVTYTDVDGGEHSHTIPDPFALAQSILIKPGSLVSGHLDAANKILLDGPNSRIIIRD